VIRELRLADQVRAACGDDDLVMWAAQGMTDACGARAWAAGDAVVVASNFAAGSAGGVGRSRVRG
jgi:hypothetical protein